jgi:hypothetical protein
MQYIVAVVVIFLSTASSFNIIKSTSGYRSLKASSTGIRCKTNLISFHINKSVTAKWSSTETPDNEIIPAVMKADETTESADPAKMESKIPVADKAEWLDPVAVAAENQSPFATVFPGG